MTFSEWKRRLFSEAGRRRALSLFDMYDWSVEERVEACYRGGYTPSETVDGFIDEACAAASLGRVAPL